MTKPTTLVDWREARAAAADHEADAYLRAIDALAAVEECAANAKTAGLIPGWLGQLKADYRDLVRQADRLRTQ